MNESNQYETREIMQIPNKLLHPVCVNLQRLLLQSDIWAYMTDTKMMEKRKRRKGKGPGRTQATNA